MSKVFRLYKNGNNNLTDWGAQANYSYGSTERGQILDSLQASKYFDITSIPSPFARMQLVKDAFKEIAKTDNLDADDIYGRTVSDTLDVGELFFNIDKFSDRLQVIPCDIEAIAQTLKDDTVDPRHQAVGDTLLKFLKSDAKSFNFDKSSKIYVLYNANGKEDEQIIGATSPRTLFFSTANKLNSISDDFSFGQDKPFDDDFAPLYKRDFEYVKMWFYLRNTNKATFANNFPEINDYLNKVRNFFDSEKRQILDSIQESENFEAIDTDTEAADHVQVLGIPVVKKKVSACKDSQFEIDSKLLEGQPHPWPLVLPVEAGINYSSLRYTEDKWGSENKAPYYDDLNLENRKLPKPGNIKQPYLTISDFLEDYIIKVPHKLNREFFFDGNMTFRFDETQLSYLLPLKPMFFDYFTIDALQGMVGHHKMIELETKPSGSVKVTLRIPIKGDDSVKDIVYSRIYFDNDKHDLQANRDRNTGAIREFDFTGLIMPNYQFPEDSQAYYTLSCISEKSREYEYHVFTGSKEIPNIPVAVRNPCDPKSEARKAKNYTLEKHNFDYIQISDSSRTFRGIILPIKKKGRGNSKMRFAVDLGTSNTLVEYAVENSTTGKITPTIFEFKDSDTQVCQMFKQTINQLPTGQLIPVDLNGEMPLIEKDFLPQCIGSDSDFKFPTRTVLSAKNNIDWNTRIDPFGLVNIPMTYDKRKNLTYNTMYFDIKWGQGIEAKTILEKYIDTLMVMMRNKVVLNDGDLSKTEVTWFYPISMSPNRQTDLRQIWDDSYKKYFNPSGKTTAVTESSAPVKAFYETDPSASQIVSVDIGGGTTDMAISKKKGEVSYVTSFRFATNDLFETPYSKVNNRSGIIDYFKSEFRTILDKDVFKELLSIFDNEDNQDPANMASFLFSLKENSLITKNDVNIRSIDFSYCLQKDPYFKVVFLIYYSAIIYHMAKIIKVANKGKSEEDLFVPRHITFSGNGSKIINTLTPDIPGVLTQYTRMILNKVAGIDCKDLTILGLAEGVSPKEATCKGGLLTDGNIDDRGKNVILKGTGEDFVDKTMIFRNIKSTYEHSVVDEVSHFFDFILNDMDRSFSFTKNFLIDRNMITLAKEVCKKDLGNFISKALDMHRSTDEKLQEQVEETTFFYPIKGVLNALSTNIYNRLQTNE